MMVIMIQKNRFGEEADEYLNIKGKSTRAIYSSAFNLFLQYHRNKHGEGKGFSDYLDRIFAELQKPRREQRRIAEIELVDFINFLKELGKSNNTIRAYFAAVQNFLKYKQIMVSATFIGNLPPSVEKPINHKHEWTIEEIKIFLDSASTYRDKAIIACLFQSGLGVNELVNLNYGDIQEEYEKGIIPICLKQLVRQKTHVPFKTFFGRDAMKCLRLYLQTRKNLTSETPLFTKWGSKVRITPAAIQQKFSEIAHDLPFIKKKDLEGFNPCRPHSLRAAFKSKLVNKISDDLIEFWMGHALGGTKDAYLNMPTDELRELYMDAEKYLAIEMTSRDELTELEKRKLKLSTEIEQKIKGLEENVKTLQQELGEKSIVIDDLSRTLDQKIETIARHVFPELRAEFDEELKQLQIDFTERYKEETKISKKISKIDSPKKEQPKPTKEEMEEEPLLFIGVRKE